MVITYPTTFQPSSSSLRSSVQVQLGEFKSAGAAHTNPFGSAETKPSADIAVGLEVGRADRCDRVLVHLEP